jgi:hypothetical protein
MPAQSGCRLCGARLTETFVVLRMSPHGLFGRGDRFLADVVFTTQ